MSGYNRRFNRSAFAAGKSDSRIKGSQMEWKAKAKIAINESFDSGSCCQKDDSSVSGEPALSNMSSVSQQESHLSIDVASNTDNLNSFQRADNDLNQPNSVSIADSRLKDKQFGGSIDGASRIMRFDLCPKRDDKVIKLKAPLHVRNKEKRNQIKLSEQGPNIMILRPGMVLMKGYLSCNDQINIVKTCRELGISEGGFYEPGYRDGSKLHLKMMCLGRNWDPQTSQYSDTRPIDDSKPPEIPNEFHDMVKKAIQDSNTHIQKNIPKANSGKLIPSMLPDICIVNFYKNNGKLGLHQDKDESVESLNKGLPVVSFSIGDSAEFLYGDERDIDKADKVTLESGDVLIFGGKSRRIFHGVTCIVPDTAPKLLIEATDMCPGRLNLTFRQY